ncbi:Peptide methionine sulfoxide reductase MsrA/MsrB [bioreactor metagenome]|uniref:peptide-methionine (S)-S-oxide reductase n=1 Tax=bioreactor metagenome TaxID=1076179 RepID=A0A644Z8G2_9ZZZZ
MEKRQIYLAGGCFWGMEKLMQSIPGVLDAVSGYANGTCEADANYKTVCGGKTNFRETVLVTYDPARVSLDQLLFAYYAVVDKTAVNRQGHDIGTQYQAGIYYADDASKAVVERVAAVERARTPGFAVEIKPLENFFPAEEYHQDYLDKNPGGYCHIPFAEIARLSNSVIDAGEYARPTEAEIVKRLSPEQYAVTQNSATERPFQNEFFRNDEKGLYVDVVTGEPLFTSEDKYESSCGWPAFTKPVESAVVVEREDRTHGMFRVEVRSRAGDSHLGHVFENDPESPNGVRYCINSAALRFIPYDKLRKKATAT